MKKDPEHKHLQHMKEPATVTTSNKHHEYGLILCKFQLLAAVKPEQKEMHGDLYLHQFLQILFPHWINILYKFRILTPKLMKEHNIQKLGT